MGLPLLLLCSHSYSATFTLVEASSSMTFSLLVAGSLMSGRSECRNGRCSICVSSINFSACILPLFAYLGHCFVY